MTTRIRIGGLLVIGILGLAGSQGCGEDEPAADDADASTSASSTSSSGSGPGGGSSGESSSSGGSSSSSSSSSGEADAGGLTTTCDDACRTTTLTVTLGDKTGVFDQVRFGFNKDGTLHVEATRGSPTKCPTEISPDPDFMSIVGTPRPVSSLPLMLGAGLSSSFLDFAGVVVEEFPPSKVTTASLTPSAGLFEPSDAGFFAYDLQSEFESGVIITGHAFATYCPSLDEP